MSNRITEADILAHITFSFSKKPSDNHLMVIFQLNGSPRYAAFVKKAEGTQDEYEMIPIPSKLDNFNNRPAIFDRIHEHKAEDLVQPKTDSPMIF